MCGVSGSGKTYVARKFEKKGFVRVSSDVLVWNEYGLKIHEMPMREQMEVYRIANEHLIERLRQLLAEGKRVVVDSTMCKRAKRDAALAVCREAGVKGVIVYLSAPENVLLKRLAQRRGACADDQPVTPEQLSRFLANFEVPDPDEPCIRLK